MREPLHHYMRVGIVYCMAYPECLLGQGPVLETLQRFIDDEFFDLVEISPIPDPAVRREAVARLQAAGMSVGMAAQVPVNVQGLDPNSLDEGTRQHAVEVLLQTVRDAAEAGIRRVAVNSGPDPGLERRSAALDALRRSLITLAKEIGQYGGDLVLEVFDRDVDKKRLVGPVDTALAIARAVRAECPNFGLMVDLSHIPLLGESPRGALVPVQDYLTHIHIGNAVIRDRSHPAWGDNHPRFGVAGGENGVPQLVEFLRTLLEIGYLAPDRQEPGIVSFEVKPMAGEDSRIVVANAKRTLLEAWRRV